MPIFALIRRGLLSFLLIIALAVVPTTPPVSAQPGENLKYAAIVVDAETGEVLFGRYADELRYPASTVKMMTMYLTFEALTEGRIKLDDVITVSNYAASQVPGKLGLAPGQTISVDDAMKATAVRSYNDMAVALAEHIAGSEANFAARMTRKARELGMTKTTYINANGLTDSRQRTSAHDLTILARAIMRDYPQYYRYFGLHDWEYNGRTYRNTNALLRTEAGYDGMKTGTTDASGLNLVASAVRDGKRIITVVLGGRTSASRNAHVAALTDTGFELERLRRSGQSIQLAQAFFESRGFGIGPDNSGPVQYAGVSDGDDESSAGSTAVSYAALPAAPPAPMRVTPAPSEERTVAALLRAGGPSDVTASLNSAPATRPAPPRAQPRESAGRWAVQVGAFRDETVARNWLTEVNRRFRSQFAAAERSVQNAEGWYRSRFTGMSEQAAQAACATLAERRVTCMVVRPQ